MLSRTNSATALERAAALLRAAPDSDVRAIGRAIHKATTLLAAGEIEFNALAVGLGEFLASGARGSITEFLKQRARGGVSPAQAARMQERDRLLRWLRDEYWSGLSPAAAAREFLRTLDRYERRRFPRERCNADAPVDEPARSLWQLLRLSVPIPRSAKQIRQIFGK